MKMRQARIERTKKYSIRDGIASSLSNSITETYVPQLLLALKGTSFHLSLLSAFSSSIAPWFQLLGDKLLERIGRKKLAVIGSCIQALCFIPLIWLGLHADGTTSIYTLIGAYTLLTLIASIHAPAWFSWIGNVVTKNRGAFFSKRQRAMALASLLIIFGGLALDHYQKEGNALVAFAGLFTLAALCRATSAYYLTKQYEPPYKVKRGIPFSLVHFMREKTAISRLAWSLALYNAAVYLASPFFALYMRQTLQLSYTWITLITLAATLCYIIVLPYAGKFSDRFGNIRLIYLGMFLYGINPLLWLWFNNPYLLLIVQIAGGIANASFILGTSNFMYNKVAREQQAIVSTYLNILSGLGIFVGSLLGGLLMRYHPSMLSAISFTFIISACARLVVMHICMKPMRETEKVLPLPKNLVPTMVHPLRTLHAELSFVKTLKR